MKYPKFKIFTLVRIAAEMPRSMFHFPHDCYAIIAEYDICQGDIEYGVYILDGKDKIVNYSAWYDESQLFLPSYDSGRLMRQHRPFFEKLVWEYNYSRKGEWDKTGKSPSEC